MNPRPSLREALARADVADLDHVAEEVGRQAIISALAEAAAQAETPTPRRYEPNDEDERQRLLDAALADAIETVARHRNRLGRRVCSMPDGRVTRKIFELLRGMADASGGVDNDPSFQ